MNKKLLILAIVVMSLVTLIGCSSDIPMGSPMLGKQYFSLEELSKDAPLVISAKVVGESREFQYDGIYFVETEVKIKEVYRDDIGLDKNVTIKLLQTHMEEDPIVNKNEELMLFLEKYEGPIIDDAFIIVGAWFGQFKIEDGKIYSKVKERKETNDSHDNSSTKINQIKFPSSVDIKVVEGILKQNKYQKPQQKTEKSLEEIEKLNGQEKMLEQELTEIKQ